MPLDHWLAFAASAVMLAVPGPMLLVVAGVGLGSFTNMTASMLGLGAVLAASSTAFTALRRIGSAYLVYLGVKLWRAPMQVGEPGGEETRVGPTPTR